jgi:hypothetical protein
MSKTDRQQRTTAVPGSTVPAQTTSRSSTGILSAIVAGLAILVVFAYLILSEMRGIHGVLDARSDQIDSRLMQLAAKVELFASRPAAAAPAGNGPDPNRVYVVNTDGAAVAGPPLAAITIAEFSDFQ